MSVYPKWIFHKTKQACLVNSKEEHDKAGEGWEETPAAFDKKQDAKTEKSKASTDETTVGPTSDQPEGVDKVTEPPAKEKTKTSTRKSKKAKAVEAE